MCGQQHCWQRQTVLTRVCVLHENTCPQLTLTCQRLCVSLKLAGSALSCLCHPTKFDPHPLVETYACTDH